MANNAHVCHAEQVLRARGEHPLALAPLSKVFLLNPVGVFPWVAPFGPSPKHLVEAMVTIREGLFANHGTVVGGPSTQERVDQVQQRFRTDGPIRVQERLHLPQEGQFTGLGGFDEELAVVLAEVKSKEIEPVRNMGDMRFFVAQLDARVRL